MLVLTRRSGELINIGDDIVIRILMVSCGQVRIEIQSPQGVQIARSEIRERIQQEIAHKRIV